MTPPPGSLTAGMMTPPGMVTPSPTTLSAAAGQVQPTKSKTPFVIAAALTVVLAAGGVFMLLNKKKDSEPAAQPDQGSNVVAVDKGSAQQQQTPQPPPPPPPPPDTKGSAAAAGSAVTVDKGSGATKGSAETKEVKDVVSLSAVTISSTPPGAEILINGASIGKKTPATLNLPMGKDVNVLLKLSGHADYKKAVVVDKDAIALDVPLRKTSSSSGKTTGKGKGSGQKACDTCLERPD
ncbi:MAG TPA: PEGA domain-containing protein, partial [Kofleriaceae bacterium]